jgi:hypothetical protein
VRSTARAAGVDICHRLAASFEAADTSGVEDSRTWAEPLKERNHAAVREALQPINAAIAARLGLDADGKSDRWDQAVADELRSEIAAGLREID